VVEDPEVDPSMTAARSRARPGPALLLALVLVGTLAPLLLAGLPVGRAVEATPAAASNPVTGNVTGPNALALSTSGNYTLRATGGPGVLPDGEQIGNLSWSATVAAANTTNVSVAPTSGNFTVSSPGRLELVVSNVSETVTLEVEYTSTYNGHSATLNVTYAVAVVVPYKVEAKLVTGPYANLLTFKIAVYLDGTQVGTVDVPALSANETYTLTYNYATTGFSPGWHTFTLSVANEHGLVAFTGGVLQYSQSFYVPGPPPNYTIWYLAGTVAFFGALFILATRVAARRRGGSRR
jgi:hypothetical protein